MRILAVSYIEGSQLQQDVTVGYIWGLGSCQLLALHAKYCNLASQTTYFGNKICDLLTGVANIVYICMHVCVCVCAVVGCMTRLRMCTGYQ